MVRDMHSAEGKESYNGLEAMISFFGLQEGQNQNKTALLMTAVKYKVDFLVYGMEISLVQPNVSVIKLAFSSRRIVWRFSTVENRTRFDRNTTLLLEDTY